MTKNCNVFLILQNKFFLFHEDTCLPVTQQGRLEFLLIRFRIKIIINERGDNLWIKQLFPIMYMMS